MLAITAEESGLASVENTRAWQEKIRTRRYSRFPEIRFTLQHRFGALRSRDARFHQALGQGEGSTRMTQDERLVFSNPTV
jgi:hypothetical protein